MNTDRYAVAASIAREFPYSPRYVYHLLEEVHDDAGAARALLTAASSLGAPYSASLPGPLDVVNSSRRFIGLINPEETS